MQSCIPAVDILLKTRIMRATHDPHIAIPLPPSSLYGLDGLSLGFLLLN
jgi:hypothetical protein